MNLYGYVANASTGLVDPSGLDPDDPDAFVDEDIRDIDYMRRNGWRGAFHGRYMPQVNAIHQRRGYGKFRSGNEPLGFYALSIYESAEGAATGAAASGIKANAAAGRAGEAACGLVKNNRRIESVSGSARYRIPDHFDDVAREIGEIKNVKRQHLSRQIKDTLAWAQKEGYQYVIYVRDGLSNLTKPLQDLVNKGDIILRKIGGGK